MGPVGSVHKKFSPGFHMPGHKGKYLPVPELAGLATIDVTELTGRYFPLWPGI